MSLRTTNASNQAMQPRKTGQANWEANRFPYRIAAVSCRAST
jgi:hypothetical protein